MDFSEATCRQYEENVCNRGGYCNFMYLKKISRELRRRLFGRSRHRHSRSRSPHKHPNHESRGHGSHGSGRREDDRERRRHDRDRRPRSHSPGHRGGRGIEPRR